MHQQQQAPTLNVYPQRQQIITTVTMSPNDAPPQSNSPGVTFVQLKPGYFTTLPGILKLIEIVSKAFVLKSRFYYAFASKVANVSNAVNLTLRSLSSNNSVYC